MPAKQDCGSRSIAAAVAGNGALAITLTITPITACAVGLATHFPFIPATRFRLHIAALAAICGLGIAVESRSPARISHINAIR
jgi:hypothetical protein